MTVLDRILIRKSVRASFGGALEELCPLDSAVLSTITAHEELIRASHPGLKRAIEALGICWCRNGNCFLAQTSTLEERPHGTYNFPHAFLVQGDTTQISAT